jgi:hypothetical protein
MALDIIVVVLVYKIFTIVFKKEPDLDVIMSTKLRPNAFLFYYATCLLFECRSGSHRGCTN